MSEMIEQVARALCAANGYDPDELSPDHMMEKERVAAENPARRWEDWAGDARLAIEAMREPATQMIIAGGDAVIGAAPCGDAGKALAAWYAMIDAALAE